MIRALRGGAQEPPPDARSAPVVASVTALAAIGVMPAFLLGATAVFVRSDLDFSPGRLGALISITLIVSGAFSIVGGRLAEHLGIRRSLRLGAAFSVVGMLGIGLWANSWAGLLLMLLVAGPANGILQPATNLALFRGVRSRQGLMFGVKQSGGAVATLLAGAAVPLVALTVGWRWAFVGTAFVGVVAALLVPRSLTAVEPPPRKPKTRLRAGDAPAPPLMMLAIGAGLGGSAATALATFLVESAIDADLSAASAGWLLAACSVGGILARLLAGWATDVRQRGGISGIAAMLTVGGIGYALLSVGGPVPTVIGGLVGYAFGWGWVGLLMYSIVRLNPNAPAAATGIVQPGMAAGAALGPWAFGRILDTSSFSVAWAVAAGSTWVSVLLVLLARRWLLASRPTPAGGPTPALSSTSGSSSSTRGANRGERS